MEQHSKSLILGNKSQVYWHMPLIQHVRSRSWRPEVEASLNYRTSTRDPVSENKTTEPLMGSSLLEEASVPNKNLVSMSSQSSLGGEPLNLPNTNSILGVDDEVLTERSSRPLSSVPDVTHHLVTMQSARQSYEVSVLTAVNPQELLNQGDLTERQT